MVSEFTSAKKKKRKREKEKRKEKKRSRRRKASKFTNQSETHPVKNNHQSNTRPTLPSNTLFSCAVNEREWTHKQQVSNVMHCAYSRHSSVLASARDQSTREVSNGSNSNVVELWPVKARTRPWASGQPRSTHGVLEVTSSLSTDSV